MLLSPDSPGPTNRSVLALDPRPRPMFKRGTEIATAFLSSELEGGLGFKVEGLGFRFWGLGFKV